MDKDKSILEKITDSVKDIASIAANAASHALEAEEPPLKADQRAVAYMPLAADGLVSDPLMVAPAVVARARRKRRAATKPAAKAGRKTGKKARPKKPGQKSAGKGAKDPQQGNRQTPGRRGRPSKKSSQKKTASKKKKARKSVRRKT